MGRKHKEYSTVEIPDEVKEKLGERDSELESYLTDSIIISIEDEVNIISEKEMSDIISKKIVEKDFITVDQIIESAKRINIPFEVMSKMVQRSIRIPFQTFIQLLDIGNKRNISLADIIRISSVPVMIDRLKKYENIPRINKDKMDRLFTLIDKWKDKESSSIGKRYKLEKDRDIKDIEREYPGISDIIKRYIEYDIKERCERKESKIDICNIENLKEYIDENLLLGPIIFIDTGGDFPVLKFQIYSIDINNKMSEIKEVANIYVKNGNLFIDDIIVDDTNKLALSNFLYNKLCKEDLSESTVLNYEKLINNSIIEKDYDKASLYSKKLLKLDTCMKISDFLANLLLEIAKSSQVITFTINDILLLLWDVSKGERSPSEFLTDLLEKNMS